MRPPLDDSCNRYLTITFGVLDNVTGYKKKSALFLITALLIGATFVVCLNKSTADEQKIMDPKFKAGFLLAGEPNSLAGANNGFGSRELFFKTMSMVVVVSVLGVTAIYASKKLLPKITNLPGKEIHITETVHLGQRKTVHLLRIGNQWLLIGSTNEHITKLADVTDAVTDLHVKEMDTVRV